MRGGPRWEKGREFTQESVTSGESWGGRRTPDTTPSLTPETRVPRPSRDLDTGTSRTLREWNPSVPGSVRRSVAVFVPVVVLGASGPVQGVWVERVGPLTSTRRDPDVLGCLSSCVLWRPRVSSLSRRTSATESGPTTTPGPPSPPEWMGRGRDGGTLDGTLVPQGHRG